MLTFLAHPGIKPTIEILQLCSLDLEFFFLRGVWIYMDRDDPFRVSHITDMC